MKCLFKILALLLIGVLMSCGPDSSESGGKPKPTKYAKKNNPEGALNEWQLIHGMGPIKEEMKLDPIDEKIAASGQKIFETKCSVCHKMSERYVGPPLGDVAIRRSPEFIMNMILDPASMIKYHPEVKRLLAQYYTPMAFQNVTEEDARKILEYLRLEARTSH
ncbi:MAG: c-type cytochrome [Calditrichia bacterium]